MKRQDEVRFMDQRYVLSYDFGTGSVKGALVTMKGEVAAVCTTPYPLLTPQPGWAEQSPTDYWNAVCTVTRGVLKNAGVRPECVAGMAFGTMWKGIIPIDAEGNVLHNSIIWLDARAEDQARRLNEWAGAVKFSADSYWAKLMWLRENRPEVVEKAVVILETNAFLKWKATGVAAVDISNSFVSSFDPELEEFYRGALRFMDIPQEKFPRVVASTELVGRVTPGAAEELGLVPGIPVFGGNSDIHAITAGSGCAGIGGVHAYFGSSGWVGYTIPHIPAHKISPFDQNRDTMLVTMRAVGLSLNWVADRLYGAERAEMGDEVFSLINREVEQIPAGSDGVLCTPWFFGESAPLLDLDARGGFLNLSPHHDRRHMTRALMEGVCYTLKMRVKNLKDYPWPEAINAVGGGSLSNVWMQSLADVMNVPVRVPEATRHAGAVGTAYSALIGLGECADYEEASRRIRYERIFYPNPDAVALYEDGYRVFEQLYTMLKPMFAHFNSN